MDKQKQGKDKLTKQSALHQEQQRIEANRKALEKSTAELAELTTKMENRLTSLQQNRFIKMLDPNYMKQKIRNLAAYALGRRNLKRLYSKTYKRKQASNDLLPYTRLLYEEGFIERALHDLKSMYKLTTNHYLKQAIAQELALFYANKETKAGAKIALYYIQTAKQREHDLTARRQLAIVEAECLVRLDDNKGAQQVLHEQLQEARHRDLYLALANTEATVEARLFWLNEILEKYEHQPIILDTKDATEAQLTYDTLHKTTVAGSSVSGPKISVILPAYNAADSIHLAIESMLKQTWTNIELLIVDDCSRDNTYEVMQRYAASDDRIKLFQTEENSGPYVARNIALKAATGEFVTVNDADDWSHREKLAVQATHLLENKTVIANTSELARLTENFDFHRRGTRGTYIFSNMSSLLFRRREVQERIGYWDEVRFAADGEFKRRLIHEFGQEAVVDLQTGPLSLPEQSTGSLTGSSAFGYAGFFMGARKEYVASFSHYHKEAANLYYPAGQGPPWRRDEGLFPVPEPMLPTSKRTKRQIDVLIVANFYDLSEARAARIQKQIEKNKQLNMTTGLVQLYDYDTVKRTRTFDRKIRNLIDGKQVQMVVYGEKIKTEIIFIHSVESLQEEQQYIANINNRITIIVIDELPKVTYNRENERNYNMRQIIRQSGRYFSNELRIYPLDDRIRKGLISRYKRELGNIRLAAENWLIEGELEAERYGIRLRDWLIEEHEYK